MAYLTCQLTFTHQAEIVRTSLSAVRHIGSHLWLGCDETATLERLTLAEDAAEQHHQFAVADYLDLPDADDAEIDIEGIAYTDYYLWFVGSHSLKRKRVKPEASLQDNLKRLRKVEREANRYTLGRIPLVDGMLHKACPHPQHPDLLLTAAQLKRKKHGNELTHRLADDDHLGDFLQAKIPGKDNGFDIEGLAVIGDRVLVGLRGPVLRGWAVLLELELKEEDLGVLRLRKMGDDKARYRKHWLNLGGLGIRDLCLWNDQLLVLAGPTMTLHGSVRVFTVPLSALENTQSLLTPTLFREIPFGELNDRAEGITVFGPESRELLVVYDAPAPDRLKGADTVLGDRIPL